MYKLQVTVVACKLQVTVVTSNLENCELQVSPYHFNLGTSQKDWQLLRYRFLTFLSGTINFFYRKHFNLLESR